MKAIEMKPAIELKKPEAKKGENMGSYDEYRVSTHLKAFTDSIQESVNTPAIPTGFDKLDSVLDGGLYAGLYFVGAISSLGKTTFVMQIADQMAQQGNDVLIFSLEMARYELMAKSISRTTLLNAEHPRQAKTVHDIMVWKRYENYSPEEIALIKQAVYEYGGYADNIYIVEGVGDVSAGRIKEDVERHIRATGKTPVVIIDYLQLIEPEPNQMRDTTKQVIDKAVMELKRISRDLKTPVIAISSLNRQSYKDESNMAAFKESGAIEYSSDVLIGMQLKGVGTSNFDVDAAKRKDPREVEVVILKNRNGQTGDKLNYRYYQRFNCFQECAGSKEATWKRI